MVSHLCVKAKTLLLCTVQFLVAFFMQTHANVHQTPSYIQTHLFNLSPEWLLSACSLPKDLALSVPVVHSSRWTGHLLDNWLEVKVKCLLAWTKTLRCLTWLPQSYPHVHFPWERSTLPSGVVDCKPLPCIKMLKPETTFTYTLTILKGCCICILGSSLLFWCQATAILVVIWSRETQRQRIGSSCSPNGFIQRRVHYLSLSRSLVMVVDPSHRNYGRFLTGCFILRHDGHGV